VLIDVLIDVLVDVLVNVLVDTAGRDEEYRLDYLLGVLHTHKRSRRGFIAH
jgi:hypothetical protein